MATAATEVFRATVPSVGLTLKVRASLGGKQPEYEKRIKEDDATSDCCVPYMVNSDWTCSFNEGKTETSVGAHDEVSYLPVFFETRYFFRGDFASSPKPIRSVTINHRLASVEDSFNFDDGVLVGTLDFINEPGKFRLDLKIVFTDDSWKVVSFEFFVVSVKMNIRRDYDSILNTIEKARPHLAQSFLSKSFWGAALDGENKGDDKTWYQILSDVFEYYVKACKRIINNPHQRFVRVDEYRRADRIRRWTPSLVNSFNRLGPDQQTNMQFRTTRVEGAIDTPENRFVLYTLRELARRLDGFADEQDKNDLVSKEWIKGVRVMSADLVRLSRHSFFAAVGRFDGFRQQSLVMQREAGYAQIFSVWLKLKRALKPGGDEVDMSYRPISMLYEFWCFLKMREMLEAKMGKPVKDEVTSTTEDDLLETPELDDDSKIDENKLNKLNVEFRQGDVTCVLTYQKTYNVRSLDGTDAVSFSSLNPQRPDIVLTICCGEGEYSYLFDAKYRIWTMPGRGQKLSPGQPNADADATTRDALDAMYRYRDAILYRMHKAGLKREIVGAYVLYPGRSKPHLYETYRKTIEQEGIGAIPILPGFEDELKSNIEAILSRHTPNDHLKIATSVRGTSTVVGEAIGEQAILDCTWINLEKGDARNLTDKGPVGTAPYIPVIPVERLDGRSPFSIKFITIYAKGSVPVTLTIKNPENNGNPMSALTGLTVVKIGESVSGKYIGFRTN